MFERFTLSFDARIRAYLIAYGCFICPLNVLEFIDEVAKLNKLSASDILLPSKRAGLWLSSKFGTFEFLILVTLSLYVSFLIWFSSNL